MTTQCLVAQDKIAGYSVKNIQQIHFYWKNESRQNFFTINALNNWLSAKKQSLVFAMNGGMFTPEFTPVGLYIEKKQVLKKLKNGNKVRKNLKQPVRSFLGQPMWQKFAKI